MTAPYRVFSQVALDPAALVRGARGLGRGLVPPLDLEVQGVHPALALPDPHDFLGVGARPTALGHTVGAPVSSPDTTEGDVSLPHDMEAPFILLCAARGDEAADYRLIQRLPTEGDWDAARRAEAASRAYGMADLARRCPQLWELHPLPPASAEVPLTLLLCAVAASVALGPVLPADEAALFGVRGARLRAGV